MAVGTGNITLQDVTTEIYADTAAGRSLSACFASSTAGTFDGTYVGVKDRLSNFKGYVHVDDGIWSLADMVNDTSFTGLC